MSLWNCDCPKERLCDDCFQAELRSRLPTAPGIGWLWADRVWAANPEFRELPWPDLAGKAAAIAAQLVATQGKDPRLLETMVASVADGAAARWARLQFHAKHGWWPDAQ